MKRFTLERGWQAYLEGFVRAREQGRAPSAGTLRALEGLCRAVLRGEDPAVVLGVERRRGRPLGSTQRDRVAIANDVLQRRRAGETLEAAAAAVASEHAIEKETAKEYFQEMMRWARSVGAIEQYAPVAFLRAHRDRDK